MIYTPSGDFDPPTHYSTIYNYNYSLIRPLPIHVHTYIPFTSKGSDSGHGTGDLRIGNGVPGSGQQRQAAVEPERPAAS